MPSMMHLMPFMCHIHSSCRNNIFQSCLVMVNIIYSLPLEPAAHVPLRVPCQMKVDGATVR